MNVISFDELNEDGDVGVDISSDIVVLAKAHNLLEMAECAGEDDVLNKKNCFTSCYFILRCLP